jgi:hypothetical protein
MLSKGFLGAENDRREENTWQPIPEHQNVEKSLKVSCLRRYHGYSVRSRVNHLGFFSVSLIHENFHLEEIRTSSWIE